jgi:hypothetical protein
MINYFADQPADVVVPDKAASLLKDYRFLDQNPETTVEPIQECRFKSHFLYELIATAHMSGISGYIPINGLVSKECTAGKNSAGVLAIACAAVSFQFICFWLSWHVLTVT